MSIWQSTRKMKLNEQIIKIYHCNNCNNDMEVIYLRGLRFLDIVECDKCEKTARITS